MSFAYMSDISKSLIFDCVSILAKSSHNGLPNSKLMVQLAQLTSWKWKYKPKLNCDWKGFIASYPMFFTLSEDGLVVTYTGEPLPVGFTSLPIETKHGLKPTGRSDGSGVMTVSYDKDDIYRPFDHHDEFFHDDAYLMNMNKSREFMWSTLKTSLKNIPESRSILDKAFQKCARLTLHIVNLMNNRSRNDVIALLYEHVGTQKCSIYHFQQVIEGYYYQESFTTVLAPGSTVSAASKPLNALINDIRNNLVAFSPKEALQLMPNYGCGGKPHKDAVMAEVRNLLSNMSSPLSGARLSVPVRSVEASSVMPSSQVSSFTVPLPPSEHWPYHAWDDFVSLHDSVFDFDSEFYRKLKDDMRSVKDELVQLCNQLQAERVSGMVYNHVVLEDGSLLEWVVCSQLSGTSRLFIGSSVSSLVHYGLLSNDKVLRQLVVVKESKERFSFFKEGDGGKYCALSTNNSHGGLIRYISSESDVEMLQLRCILVQDAGLCSLAHVIRYQEMLTDSERFKLMKAMCLSLQVLHSKIETPMAHGNLTPDNFLIMPNGTLCISDYGIDRTHRRRDDSLLSPLSASKTLSNCSTASDNMSASTVTEAASLAGTEEDIYMLGLCMVKLFGESCIDEFDSVRRSLSRQGMLSTTEPWLFHLLSRMVSAEGEDRPSIKDVLSHPFFFSRDSQGYFQQNFIQHIECIVVADGKPVDSDRFRVLEKLLDPVEKVHPMIRSMSWKTGSLVHLNAYFPNSFRVGFPLGSRSFPLTKLAEFLRFLKILLLSFQTDPLLGDLLRRSKPDGGFYKSPGEFFLKHPAVHWLMPEIWLHKLKYSKSLAYRKVKLMEESVRLQEEVNAFNQYEGNTTILPPPPCVPFFSATSYSSNSFNAMRDDVLDFTTFASMVNIGNILDDDETNDDDHHQRGDAFHLFGL